MASTSIGQSITSFLDASGQFFSDLAAVHWPALLLGLLFFGLNLTLRSRAFFNSLRAAYPATPFQWRRIWGAYVAAVGFNNVVPARGGDIIKLFLARSSIPGSRYPTVAAAFFVEAIFDVTVGIVVLIFAFTQGVFPKPPDFSKLELVRHLLSGVAFQADAVPDHRPRDHRRRRLRAAVRAGPGVLVARAPGLHDPQRPPALPAGRSPRCRRSRGSAASSRSGSCWTRSVSAGRSTTCSSSSASTRWRERCRSRPAARASSRRCSSRSSRPAPRRPSSPPTRSGSR